MRTAHHQSLWTIDHIEYRLAASNAQQLAQWCEDVDAVTGDSGFMNILVGSPGWILPTSFRLGSIRLLELLARE